MLVKSATVDLYKVVIERVAKTWAAFLLLSSNSKLPGHNLAKLLGAYLGV
jgi:hypothetical protein